MTTTTEAPVAETTVSLCRNCHLKIEMLGGDWTDPDGCTGCMFPADAAYHPHEPVPPSAVADRIAEWTEVREGDLIVWDGEFRLITRMFDYAGQPLMWFDGSVLGPGTLPCGTYACVRRYLTEEG